MKTLLVLGAGRLQVPAIEVGRSLGLRVVAADGDPGAVGLAMADRARVVQIADPSACLAVAREERIDGVLHICSEVAMPALGLINGEMGLCGPDAATVARATNKALMRRAFERGGAPSPRSIAADTAEAAVAAAAEIAGPVILKPSRNSGSRGVTQLPAGSSAATVAEAFRVAMDQSRDPSVVVEQFVEGPEFSVEALAWNGRIEILAVTDKITTGTPHFVEMGHTQPTRFVGGQAKVREAAIRGIRALGLDGCAAHAEVKLAEDGPYLMEIGARLGGDFITTELVPRSTGIGMVAAAIRLALGEEPDLTPVHAPQGAAIRYLAPPPGVVTAIAGVDVALAMPGVRKVEVYVTDGERVGAVDSSLARAGHVIAEGVTAADAAEHAERAAARVVIGTRAWGSGTTGG